MTGPMRRTLSARHRVIWLMPLLMAVGGAHGQPNISSSIRQNEAAVSSTAEQRIEQFMNHWCERLSNGPDAEVRPARVTLTEPLLSLGSDTFKAMYSTRFSSQLDKVLKSERVVVRINAMIAVGKLTDRGAVKLIEVGLADKSPGVRFHAGRAMNNFAQQNRLGDEDQRTALKCVAEACRNESFQLVLEQLIGALGSLTIGEAQDVLLDELNKRVDAHVANPTFPVRAEYNALKQMFRRLFLAVEGYTVPKQKARAMIVVSFRYLCLAARLLPTDLPNALKEDYIKMVMLGDAILHEFANAINAEVKLPSKIGAKPKVQDLLLRCAEWETVLRTQLRFKPEKLEIAQRKGK